MPKKVKKASKKRGGSSSQQADYSLMFASDFTDFKPETFQSSPSNNSDDIDAQSDVEEELFAHYYFSSTTTLPVKLDTFLCESFDITTSSSDEPQDLCHGDKKKKLSTTAAAPERTSTSDGNGDSKGHVTKRHRSTEEGEIIVLSSGSEDMGGASDDMDLDTDSGDQQWSVDQKDVMGRNAYEKRYGVMKQRGYGRLSKCYNCKQKGHASSMCPYPKRNQVCYLCGVVGHVSMRCPDSRCQYCFQRNHRGRQCNPSYSFGTCGRCYMKGHVDSNCPDGWRQFHNTTSKDRELVKFTAHEMKRNCTQYCANCAQRGHFVHECSRSRLRGVPYPFFPYIARYNDSQFVPRPHPHHSDPAASRGGPSSKNRRASLPDYPSRSDKRKRRRDHEEDSYQQEPSRKKSKHHRRHSKHEDHDHGRFPRRTLTDPLPHSTPDPAHHYNPPPPPFTPHDDGLLATPPLRSLSFEHSRTPYMPPLLSPPPPLPFPPYPPPPPPPPAYHYHHHRVPEEQHFPRTPFTHQHYSQPGSAHIPRPPPQHRPARRHSEGNWSRGASASYTGRDQIKININGYWDNDRGFVKERNRR